jgi:hypothetical protein
VQTVEHFAAIALDRPISVGEGLGAAGKLAANSEFAELIHVDPNGAAAAAGLRVGDKVYIEPTFGSWGPGTKAHVLVERRGERYTTSLTVGARAKRSRLDRSTLLAGECGMLGLFGFGLLLVIRGRHNHAATMLGLILLGAFSDLRSSIYPPAFAAAISLLIWIPVSSAIAYCWPIFAMEISGGPTSARQRRIVRAAGAAIWAIMFYWKLQLTFPVPMLLPSAMLFAVGVLPDQLVGYAVIVANYRRADMATRNRIKIIVGAIILITASAPLGVVVDLASGPDSIGISLTALQWLQVGSTSAGLTLLAYAVLRRRLFDLNFAINRTLVYGAVSFTLLAAFGLAEWGADRLVPEEWHRQSALYSAGIALLLFLSFHRVRDWFEHHVSRLFFARWQQAEAELKRFVASAGHFEQAPALCRGFEAALTKFAAAEAAVYLRDSGGTYRLQCGGFGGSSAAFADDDPAFALMRAERSPLDLTRLDATLPGALALPMLDVGTLTGFVLLGARADGAHYRPDEVDNLGWAAHQVGLDLQALHARELEAENASLREKVAWLSAPKPRRAKAQPLVALPGGAGS